MNVESILRGKGTGVVTIQPDETLTRAISLLAEKKIGAVVVSDDGMKVAGILSERDVVRGLAEGGKSALDKPVSAFMTAKVVTCAREDKVDELMAKMTTGRFRHLPVVVDGTLFGIISIGDVVKARIEDVEAEAEQLRGFIMGG
ncbi:MAG: CBS domain-containing protein [Azospirillaceae bacterium]